MDKGEWSEEDYKFEKKKQENLVKKRQIEVGKLMLNKEELLLKVSDIDLTIEQLKHKINKSGETLKWVESKINGR